MLKFVSRSQHAGAPDYDGYDAARDRLLQRRPGDRESELQAFAKRFDGCPAAAGPLTDALNDWADEGARQRGWCSCTAIIGASAIRSRPASTEL